MRSNPIQFAAVREDPRTLWRAATHGTDRTPARVLMVASGGCTAFCAHGWWPEARFVLVDPNPAQLELVRDKIALLENQDRDLHRRFNVGDDDPNGLTQCGNFESLFRTLRGLLTEFVLTPTELASWFEPASRDVETAFDHPYWRVAFELCFSDVMLETMFGPAATQHAAPGSYPDYFRARIENALQSSDRIDNPFLHHIFLGAYHERASAWPEYLHPHALPLRPRIELRAGTFDSIDDLDSYDVIDLSNVMDWMDTDAARTTADRIGARMRAGARVVWRQLNNAVDREPWFGSSVRFDPDLGQELSESDRSLFYQSVHVGIRDSADSG